MNRTALGAPLKNELGDQNCFLNVIINTIYNNEDLLDFFCHTEFENVSRLNIFSEMKVNSIYNFIKIVLDKYIDLMNPDSKTGDRFKVVDTIELRTELALLFQEERKFQLNAIDDVSELFYAFLNAIHSYELKSKSLKYIYDDKLCSPLCLSHALFRQNILEQLV